MFDFGFSELIVIGVVVALASAIATVWFYTKINRGAGPPTTMSRDTVTTKLDAFGRNPSYKTELSEEEIERAIDEIRSTIQKYSR